MRTLSHVSLLSSLADDKKTKLGKMNTATAPHKAPEYRMIYPKGEERQSIKERRSLRAPLGAPLVKVRARARPPLRKKLTSASAAPKIDERYN